MSDGNNRNNLQLQRNIQYLVYIFSGRHPGSSETLTDLHPAASQPQVFRLQLNHNRSYCSILNPDISSQRVSHYYDSQCSLCQESSPHLLAMRKFLQCFFIVHCYKLPTITALGRWRHQRCSFQLFIFLHKYTIRIWIAKQKIINLRRRCR